MNITLAYKIFELSESASQQDIKIKYKQLVLKFHPDRNKSPDANKVMAEIIEAYKFLRSTPTERIKSKPAQQYRSKSQKRTYNPYESYSTYSSTQNSNTWTFTFD